MYTETYMYIRWFKINVYRPKIPKLSIAVIHTCGLCQSPESVGLGEQAVAGGIDWIGWEGPQEGGGVRVVRHCQVVESILRPLNQFIHLNDRDIHARLP